jgi:cell wall assembly regulator SMI1
MVDATTTSKTRLDTPPLGTFVCDDESDNSSWELTMDMTLSQIRVASRLWRSLLKILFTQKGTALQASRSAA